MDGYRKMINHAAEIYPNFKAVATTLREVKTATVNDWSAICWADGQIYQSREYKGLEIMDRVGGGDSFASGLIYGLMTTGNAETAVNYGAAHGALAMTTPGDTTMVNKKESGSSYGRRRSQGKTIRQNNNKKQVLQSAGFFKQKPAFFVEDFQGPC